MALFGPLTDQINSELAARLGLSPLKSRTPSGSPDSPHKDNTLFFALSPKKQESPDLESKKENTPPGPPTTPPFASPTKQNPAKRVHKEAASPRAKSQAMVDAPDQMPAATSNNAFRAALRDGVLLCKVLNAIRPGIIPRVAEEAEQTDPETGELIISTENIDNFLRAVEMLALPSAAIFSIADIDSDGWEERPRVVECLLTLRRYHETEKQSMELLKTPNRPFMSPVKHSAHSAHVSPMGASRSETPDFDGVTQQFMHGGRAGQGDKGALAKPGAGKGVQAAVGVTRLMQQCTAMLRERMCDGPIVPRVASPPVRYQPSSPAPESALEAMGPVLESVLGSLTQEYEKRLLAKDHEVKASQAQIEQLKAELYDVRSAMAESAHMLPAPEIHAGMSDEERAELEDMRARENEFRSHLDTLEDELQRSQEQQAESEAERQALLDEFERLQAQVDELSVVAAKYKDTVEENRKLYNEVQDLKGNIRVFCRIRPAGSTGDRTASCTELGVDGEVALYNPKSQQRKSFKYDKVFGPGSTQEEVYEDTKALIRSVLDGYNVCIFAYGQTGSGKTHTMAGTNIEAYSGRGINYRALDDLFALNAKRKGEAEYEIRVQLLEIYNEQLRDLLDETKSQKRLDIRNTERSGNNVPDAIQRPVSCTEDVLAVMEVGASNRSVAATSMNERSSRSHSVLTIIVDGINHVTGVRTHGCLHLIDLAGSERVGKSEATGDRLEEAKHINKSLSALGDVMSALASKAQHVPFRNSKLTQLLQDSLCGQAKAMMFIHVAPEGSSHSESISTLGFGSRVSEITLGQAKKNSESSQIFEAKETVAKLERDAAAARHDAEQLRAEAAAERAAAAAERVAMEREMAKLRMELDMARQGSSAPDSPSSASPASSVATSIAASAAADTIPAIRRPVTAAAAAPADPSPILRKPRMSLDLDRLRNKLDSPRATPPLTKAAARIPGPSPGGPAPRSTPLGRTKSGPINAEAAPAQPRQLRRTDSLNHRPLTARLLATPRDSASTPPLHRPLTSRGREGTPPLTSRDYQPTTASGLKRTTSAKSGQLMQPPPAGKRPLSRTTSERSVAGAPSSRKSVAGGSALPTPRPSSAASVLPTPRGGSGSSALPTPRGGGSAIPTPRRTSEAGSSGASAANRRVSGIRPPGGKGWA
ncbi:hypothetical protein WJX72_005827 [[Myrmecia] bisecta]|uniref:Kinesin n=1 Tax=[Myrmecia] bisecta TaxID=41462 RepID=A0AAW1P8Z9_9CHLO